MNVNINISNDSNITNDNNISDSYDIGDSSIVYWEVLRKSEVLDSKKLFSEESFGFVLFSFHLSQKWEIL